MAKLKRQWSAEIAKDRAPPPLGKADAWSWTAERETNARKLFAALGWSWPPEGAGGYDWTQIQPGTGDAGTGDDW
jgi:hypothetical protein